MLRLSMSFNLTIHLPLVDWSPPEANERIRQKSDHALFTNVSGPLFLTLPTSGLQDELFIASAEFAPQSCRDPAETTGFLPYGRSRYSASIK